MCCSPEMKIASAYIESWDHYLLIEEFSCEFLAFFNDSCWPSPDVITRILDCTHKMHYIGVIRTIGDSIKCAASRRLLRPARDLHIVDLLASRKHRSDFTEPAFYWSRLAFPGHT